MLICLIEEPAKQPQQELEDCLAALAAGETDAMEPLSRYHRALKKLRAKWEVEAS